MVLNRQSFTVYFRYIKLGTKWLNDPPNENHKRRITAKKLLAMGMTAGLLLAFSYCVYLDFTVRARFEGRRFALPARVYARPLELYPGLKLDADDLMAELKLLSYRMTDPPGEPGSYHRSGQAVVLVTRPFTFSDGPQESMALRVVFNDGRVATLERRSGNTAIDLVRLEPALIGGIYPGNNEDRVLVRLKDVPQQVVDALIAVEDNRFFSHHGIDPRGIARALFTTLSGGGLQGGSTLTQQLVKNFYLTADRTLRRKLTEMVMAVLLELHYSKEEILETYLNEVYLGQDGNRAIHGFGLASSFFFDKPLKSISLPESALLVGLLKGPGYYSPRRHPQRAQQRRNLVLAEMAEQGFITKVQLMAARTAPLDVIGRPPRGTSPYPAFLDLVFRQLRRDYREEDLRSEGLQVITTLDPRVQAAAEKALTERLARLEQSRGGQTTGLQGAMLVTSTQNAEVQAVVGDRLPSYKGFDRALDARRPIGSLVKPIVYLTALQQPQHYTLATLLDDSPLVLSQSGTEDWMPQNYDHQSHGQVPFYTALANSYNIATARLGLALGVDSVMDNLQRIGLDSKPPAFAASLLGANALTPLEVTQVYQTIAAGGFRTPLRAISEVLTAEGQPLQRYPLEVEQVIAPPRTLPDHRCPAGRGTGGHGARSGGLVAFDIGCCGQDRHHRRFPRQLVRRIYRRSPGCGLDRPGRQPIHWPHRGHRGYGRLGRHDGRPGSRTPDIAAAGHYRKGLDRSRIGTAQWQQLSRRCRTALYYRICAH